MNLQDQAQEFRYCFEVCNSCEAREMQRNLIEEEFKEFLEAHDEMFDPVEPGYDTGEAKALKELADLVYVCFQYAENMEWDLNTAMERVHESNMSKLDDDRKPIRREDGKVLKGPNYAKPYLEDLCHFIC